MKYKKIVEFRPSISSENLGDQIIQNYITQLMKGLFGPHLTVTMPTRSHLTGRNLKHLESADYSFVCGTNLLASNMNRRRQWDLRAADMFRIHNLVLLGTGWWQYQDPPNLYTRILLKKILHPKLLHSVRDSYTEKMLKSIGINNVINTGCPTMWGLTEEKTGRIPVCKGNEVVTTLTNYMQNDDLDRYVLECLLSNYDTVYVWLQALEDYDQLKRLGYLDRVCIIAPTLEAYNEILKKDSIDYIGTRLHGGIHALNSEKRSLIIAVDNRAAEIAKDTDLPVIQRRDVETRLDEMINSRWAVSVKLFPDHIRRWKEQWNYRKMG